MPDDKKEVKLRDYRYVVIVPGYGTAEEVDSRGDNIRSILNTRLHSDGVIVQPWPLESD